MNLNFAVTKLVKQIPNKTEVWTEADWEHIEKVVKPEFLRIYDADREFRVLNKKSIVSLLTLNLRFRFIPLHSFGLFAGDE